MRYWIYWNDLVQGPFEVQELVSLRAFTADLTVCEEDRQDWVPAAAVPELLPYFQPVLTVEEPVAAAPPPPPPPTRPPNLSPLQGEFFSEPAGQQPLFDLNGSRNYVFKPIEDAAAAPEVAPPWRTPFFFRVYSPPVIEPTPTPSPAEDIEFSPPPPPITAPEREVPVFEESGSGAVEPEEIHSSEPSMPPAVLGQTPIPVVDTRRPLAMEEPFVPVIDEPVTSPVDAIEEIVIEPAQAPELVPPVRVFRAPRVAIPDFEASRKPTVEVQTRLWPWVVGVWFGLGLLGFGYYHYMGRVPHEVDVPAPAPPPAPIPVIAEPPVQIVKPKPPQPKAVVKPVKKEVPKSPPVVAEKPPAEKPLVMPGLAPAPAPEPEPAPTPSPASPAESDAWRGKELAAIDMALQHKIYAGKRTVGDNAKLILNEQHDKELLQAGETGERLYLPDKISWMALREEGARYRVYLNFQAMQANGERILSSSNQFLVDLQRKTVQPADESTRHDFFDPTAMRVYAPSAKADEIQTLLNGVDVVNKHRLHAVILKSSKQKDEKKRVQAELQAAEDKLQKEVVYFRTKYAEKTLQNVGKAYNFMAVLNGK